MKTHFWVQRGGCCHYLKLEAHIAAGVLGRLRSKSKRREWLVHGIFTRKYLVHEITSTLVTKLNHNLSDICDPLAQMAFKCILVFRCEISEADSRRNG